MGTASYPAAFAVGTWLESGIIAVSSSRSLSVALANRLCRRSVARGIPQLLRQSTRTAKRPKRTGSPVNSSRSTPPKPYEVRLVDRRFAEENKYQRRWVLARCVPTATLMQRWEKQGARIGHQACVSSSAVKHLAAVSCTTQGAAGGKGAARSAGWLFASTPDGFAVHVGEFV